MKDEHYLKKELYELIKNDERIFDFLQEGSLDGLWYWDLENPENEWMNNRFWTTLGYDPAEMPHTSNAWQDIINQDDLKTALDNFNKHIENPEHPYDQVVRYMHKNHSTIWIRCRGMAVRDENGKPIRMLGAHQDITELKQAENQIVKEKNIAKANFEKYKAIYDNAPLAIQSLDENASILDVNPQWLKTLGYQKNEVLGKWFGDFLHPCFKEPFRKQFQTFKESGSISDVHFRMVKKDKTEIVILFNGTIVCDDNGKFIQTYCTFNDITKEYQAKIALQESELKYHHLVETASDAIYFMDDTGTIIDSNKTASQLLGKPKSEIDGSKIDSIDPNFSVEAFLEFWNKVAFDQQMIFETTHKTKKGNLIPIEISGKKFKIDGKTYYYGITRDISERKLSDKALRESEEKYRALAERAKHLILVHNIKGEITYINEFGEQFLGMNRKSIIGKNIKQFLGTKEIDDAEKRMKEFLDGDIKVQNFELTYADTSGKKRYLEIIGNPIIKDSKIDSVLISAYDITIRKEAEMKLKASKEQFQLAMDASNDGLWDWNLVTNDIYFSPGWKRMLGYKEEELENKFSIWEDLTHPEDVKRTWKIFEECKVGKREKFETEIKMRHKNGSWVNVLSRADMSYDANHNPIRLIGTHVDVTERVKAQEELKTRQILFNNVLTTIPDMVSIHDSELNIVFSNWKGFAAVPKEKRIPFTKCYNTYRGYKDVCPDCKAKTVLETMKSYNSEVELPDGRWVELRVLPIKGLSPNDRMFVEWVRDITVNKKSEFILKEKNLEYEAMNEELRQVNEELSVAKEKAEQSDRLKTEFLNNMSHEIRTPMNGIIGFSSMLENEGINPERRKLFSKLIQNSSHQLLKIIDDILEISRLETKQIEISKQPFCLNDLFMELFSIFNIQSKDRKLPIYLKKGLPDKQSKIESDKSKLHKIIANLVDNALKYTNEGFIEMGYYLHNSKLVIYVRDTGIGIAPEYKNAIFERFSQINKDISRKSGGLGIGLSIVKENTEIMGGKITLESEPGVGSTFYVTIPYEPAETNHSGTNNSDRNDADPQKQCTILIAEDEEINYLFMEALLDEKLTYPHLIMHAKDGKEAVDIIKNKKDIDIVLMDIKMPVMNGHEAAKEIKSFRPGLPIIAQTAYSTDSDKEKALSNGCDDFISKPIDSARLVSLINKYVHKSNHLIQ